MIFVVSITYMYWHNTNYTNIYQTFNKYSANLLVSLKYITRIRRVFWPRNTEAIKQHELQTPTRDIGRRMRIESI